MLIPDIPLPPPGESWLQLLARLPERERLAWLAELSREELTLLGAAWSLNARREQLPPPGDWSVWMILAGRGFGKTRSGAEMVLDWHRNGERQTGIVAATVEDLKRYCLRGPSGILSIAPHDFCPKYEPGNTRLLWPNGSETLLFSAEKPERLRGPNLSKAWCDEVASWKYLEETWDNLEFALRDSDDPRIVGTTTPKPRLLLRQILADIETVTTGGSTYANAANLAKRFVKRMRRRYEGTTKGRQELHAELMDEAEGALWQRVWFDRDRTSPESVPELLRSAVAIDPAVSDSKTSNETGIVAGGVSADRRGYLLEDLSGRYSPDGWARAAILCYFRGRHNFILAEKNQGGDMVRHTIETTARSMLEKGEISTADIPIKLVWAAKGKVARADPVAGCYERREVHHVGTFAELEDQCCTYEPHSGQPSPDRYDALVWLWTKLLIEKQQDEVDVVPFGAKKRGGYRDAG